MTTEQYLSYFFSFDELDFVKRDVESSWSVSEPTMAAFGEIAPTYHMELPEKPTITKHGILQWVV